MDQPDEVATHGRVTLRRIRAEDTDAVYRTVMESLDHLRPWMAWAHDGYRRDDAVAFIEQAEHDWETGEAFNYAITETATAGEFAGACGLRRPGGPDQRRPDQRRRGPRAADDGLEIGYWLRPASTGRGLATDSAAALAGQAFTLPGITWVQIVHDLANTASGAIPRRLGFTETGRRTPPQEPRTPGEAGVDVIWRLRRDARQPAGTGPAGPAGPAG
jgi:ribosomal-protein-serine acetyltransferase